jgi:hypothetical protein
MSQAIQGRFDDPDVEEIDNWRRKQVAIPSRANALRTLVRLGLAVSTSKSDKGQERPAAAAE